MKILKCYYEECSYDSYFFNRQEGYRYLIEIDEKNHIETSVYLHYKNNIQQAIVVDISCMVGCPEKCFFCSSSKLEHKRNLTAIEILEETLLVLNQHQYSSFSNVVFSFQGIGEPSLIPKEITTAIILLRNYIPNSKITISTTGSNVKAFNTWKDSLLKDIKLQISITDYSIKDFKAIEHIVKHFEKHNMLESFAEIKFNYVLVNQANDTDSHLQNLISIFRHKPYIIRLSKLNHCIDNQYISSSVDVFNHFSEELSKNNITNYIFGSQIKSSIGCGQLIYLNNNQDGQVL